MWNICNTTEIVHIQNVHLFEFQFKVSEANNLMSILCPQYV